MRVALCAPNFPPEFLGGTERVVIALARGLRARGDEVVVVTGSDRPHVGPDVAMEDFDGIAVHRLARLPNEPYDLDLRRPRVRQVFEGVLRAGRIDLVHVHHWSTLSSQLVRAARDLGIPGIATLHDMWTNCPRFFRRAPEGVVCPTGSLRDACVPCVRLGLPALDDTLAVAGLAIRDRDLRDELTAARRLTAPSTACALRVREHLPWSGVVDIVPHGLLEPVASDERATPRTDGPLRIGTFGNLVEEKGVMLLVWACRGIPGIELHLSGPFLEPKFQALVRAKAVEFGVRLVEHGPYGPGDRHPALGLHLAVFPSLCEETYGLVVEEALARGVPVVVSDRGALAERIGEGGVAVAVDELGPLARTLRELATDPDRLAALRSGIPTAFATSDDAAAIYHTIYRDVVEGAVR